MALAFVAAKIKELLLLIFEANILFFSIAKRHEILVPFA
jgi:hypothetical protein